MSNDPLTLDQAERYLSPIPRDLRRLLLDAGADVATEVRTPNSSVRSQLDHYWTFSRWDGTTLTLTLTPISTREPSE